MRKTENKLTQPKCMIKGYVYW